MDVTVKENEWIETKLIPNITNQFGIPTNDVRWTISLPENTFFLSNVYFINLDFISEKNNGDNSGDRESLRIVVKKPPVGSSHVHRMNMDKQFHNEILFYKKIVRDNPRFPRCLHTADGTLEEIVIVTENITTLGFQSCPQVFDLPFDYVIAAVKEIGKLHAIGYAMKKREPVEFRKIVDGLREARFLEKGAWMDDFLDIVATRPIDWLRSNNYESTFCDKLENHFGNAYREVMLECVKPVEPLATICHGDFTRNNIFFRKTDGTMEAMLFDFAFTLYASPAIDLSTFLYLNVKTTDRIEKFDVIFEAYHNALIEHLRDVGITDLEEYSYEKFLADYKRRATFGFMIAIFFLPIIRGLCTCDIDHYHKDPKAGARTMRQAGGEAMTEEFGKMVLELRDTGCLDHLSY